MRYRTINIILVITNVISVLIIIQIIFELIPLNPFSFDEKKINEINNLTLGFLLGYIVNSLFFLFSTVIPHELNKTRAQVIVAPYLSDIYNRLHITQLYFKDKYNCATIDDVSSQNLQSLSVLEKEPLLFSYQEKINDTYHINSFGSFTEIDFFEEERDLVLSNIDIILANPFMSGLNEKLIFTLTKLKTELFYIGVLRHIEFRNSSTKFSYKDFEKYVEEHFQLIKEFMKETDYLKSKMSIKDLK